MLSQYKTFASFSVTDLDKAKEFYSGKLGLAALDNVPGVLILQTGEGTKFMIYQKDNHVPATYTVLNFEVSNIEDIIKKLSESGVAMEKYPEMGTDESGISSTPDGGKMAWFKDPFGNILSLLESGK